MIVTRGFGEVDGDVIVIEEPISITAVADGEIDVAIAADEEISVDVEVE